MEDSKIRILLLAPGSNPRSVTGALIGYSLAEALARLHDVTLVIRARDEESVRQANGGFKHIESIKSPWLDRLYGWLFHRIFKGDRGNLLWTAIGYPIPVVFEWRIWRKFRKRIVGKEFDVVLRILPIVPMMPSPVAFLMRRSKIPFVIGPLNGGAPWPKGFSQLQRQRAAAGNWAAGLRSFYRFLPFSRSTFIKAKAIIVGSSHTFAELIRFRNKLFFVPGENGVKTSLIIERPKSLSTKDKKLELIFAGRLVPYKACDIAIRGAARLLREERASLTILGDGPERSRLEALTDDLQIRSSVIFLGMVSHAETLSRLINADVLIFPSLREFGGGVVFEALATGVIPIVADHAGPGDIVKETVGYRIRLSNEKQMVEDIGAVLELLAINSDELYKLRNNGLAYALAELTWESKARMISEVLRWAINSGSKPIMNPPKFL